MKLDLHMHTTASDGAWSAEAVVEAAAAGGLDVISITDHDTTAAVAAAQAAAAGVNLQVIPGVELSSTYEGRDVHILGYFVDVAAPGLVKHGGRAEARREERMREMIARLAEQGIDVSFDAVERAAGADHVVIGRPHLAAALVEAGHASSVPDAFDRLIGDEHPAFVPTALLEPVGAVEIVLAAGGIPIWAHPPGDLIDPLLPGLTRGGLRGLEVYRPRKRRSELLRLESICRSTGLLMTGGSDWHSPDGGAALGDFWVDSDEIERFLGAGGM
jgi:predicted metal-dependent phosphoesterase TrpH